MKTAEFRKSPTRLRIPVGIWAEWPRGERWANEGMTRLLGFLIEGIAVDRDFVFRIVLPDWIRDEAEIDLASLAAVEGEDYTLHSPADHGMVGTELEDLVDFANDHVAVQGWLSIFPTFDLAVRLKAPLAVIFPDAIPKVIHEYTDMAWGIAGHHAHWQAKVTGLVRRADQLVTFSKHVRDQQLGRLFGIDPDRVNVVPHASPDLLPALPFINGRVGTSDSRFEAAEILREHASERGWHYLAAYPFDQVPYVAVSTQDRVTKNIHLILESVLRLVRHDRIDLKILSTAPLHYGATWTALPSAIERDLALRDLVSLPDLPRQEHAALYHCAEVAVHASIFEGGHAPFPFYEAVSVGTPCLMANGPHLEELMETEPGLRPFTFDPGNAAQLAARIREVREARVDVLRIQQDIYARLSGRGWSDVAAAYARAAVMGRD